MKKKKLEKESQTVAILTSDSHKRNNILYVYTYCEISVKVFWYFKLMNLLP